MSDIALTGAQKTYLRGQGQKIDATLKVGHAGLTDGFFIEFANQIRSAELIKVRFVGIERDQRAAMGEEIAKRGKAALISAVGHTAVFYQENADMTRRSIVFPD